MVILIQSYYGSPEQWGMAETMHCSKRIKAVWLMISIAYVLPRVPKVFLAGG